MRGTSPLVALALALPLASSGARAQPASEVTGLLTGKAAMGDWRSDAPGVRRRITPADLPPPYASPSAWNGPRIVPRPQSAWPKVPAGFHVEQLAVRLDNPRIVRAAPNGDIFIAETEPGRIRVLRTPEGGTRPDQIEVFASRLNEPFGLAFYPPGNDPQWLYVADTDAVLRFSYRNGDLTARGDPEVVVSDLPRGGHTTRDVAFSPDGKRMFVSVGSGSNDADKMPRRGAAEIAAWEAGHGLGAAWGRETNRAAVLAFDPDAHAFVGRYWSNGFSPAASETASVSPSSPGPASFGAPPTSATRWGTISSPTMSPAFAAALSTAGPGTTSVRSRIPDMPASGRT